MIALSVRVLHAVHGQQGLVIAGTQGNHPERVFKGGGLFVQQLVFHRHDVDARMKLLQDFRSEMGGEYDFHPHQLFLHLFPHTLPETERQGFRQGLLVNLIEGDRLRNPQEMLVVEFHHLLVYDGHHIIAPEEGTGGFLRQPAFLIDARLHPDGGSTDGPFRARKQEQVFIAFGKVGEVKIERNVFQVRQRVVHRQAEPHRAGGRPCFRTGNHGFRQGMVHLIENVVTHHVFHIGFVQQGVTGRIKGNASGGQLLGQQVILIIHARLFRNQVAGLDGTGMHDTMRGKCRGQYVRCQNAGGFFQQPRLDGREVFPQHIQFVGQRLKHQFDDRVKIFRFLDSPECRRVFQHTVPDLLLVIFLHTHTLVIGLKWVLNKSHSKNNASLRYAPDYHRHISARVFLWSKPRIHCPAGWYRR